MVGFCAEVGISTAYQLQIMNCLLMVFDMCEFSGIMKSWDIPV